MSSTRRLRARCPHCQRWVVGSPIHLSHRVICPGCAQEFRFVAGQAAGARQAATGALRISADVLALIPESMARSKTILPLAVEEDVVTVAAPDAMAFDLQQQLEFMLGRRVRLQQMSAAQIESHIRRHYGGGEPDEVHDERPGSPPDESPDGTAGHSEAGMKAQVKGVILAALERGRTEHAQAVVFAHPRQGELQILHQASDGSLRQLVEPPQADLADRIVNYLKANIGRDGTAILDIADKHWTLKAERKAADGGERIVLFI